MYQMQQQQSLCLETTQIREIYRYSTAKVSSRYESDSKQRSDPRKES